MTIDPTLSWEPPPAANNPPRIHALIGTCMALSLSCACARRLTPNAPAANAGPTAVAAGHGSEKRRPASDDEAVVMEPGTLSPESPSGIGRELELQGYIGTRSIRGIFGKVTEGERPNAALALRGNYRAFGQANDIQLETEPEDPSNKDGDDESAPTPEPEPEPEPSVFDEPADPRVSCIFEERTNGKVTGSVDALCDLSNDQLTIEGTWSPTSTGASLPFYLGTIAESAQLLDELLPSILRHSNGKHGCAPFVRIGQSLPSAVENRTWHSYTLHWPCDVSHDDPANPSPVIYFDPTKPSKVNAATEAPPPPTTLAYLAEFSDDFPHRMTQGPVNFDGANPDTALHIQALEVPFDGIRVYLVESQNVDEAGPNAFHCCWQSISMQYWIFATTPDGKASPPFALPKTSSTTGMGCFDTLTQMQLTTVELDGKAPRELIVTTSVNAKEQRPAPPGSPKDVWSICVDLPEQRTYHAYHYDPAQRRFQNVVLKSAAAAEKLVKEGKVIPLWGFQR